MDKDENGKIIQALSKSALCKGFTQDELLCLLEENSTEIKKYEKGSFVFEEGDVPERLYVMVHGYVEVSKLTFSGKKILITTIENPGDMFAEVYMFMGKSKYDMSAQAGEESIIFFLQNYPLPFTLAYVVIWRTIIPSFFLSFYV